MFKPKVSILMATWNRAGMIEKTLRSVQVQTFKDWELVVADDGSTDETPRVVRELAAKEPRIIYVRSDANQGISKNYNMGFAKTSGDYIAMIDDDDPWCDNRKLEKQVAFLDAHPDYVGCGGGAIVIDTNGEELYRYLKPKTDEQIRKRMLFSNPMANSTTLFRRNAAEKVGWYDSSIRYAGDRDFWLKMGLVHIPNPSFVAPRPDFRAKNLFSRREIARALSRREKDFAVEKMGARAEYGGSGYALGKLYNFPEYFSYYTMSGSNTSIARIRPHLTTSLAVMRRYQGKYPGYFLALLLNELQYAYSFLPVFLRKLVHTSLARLKRLVVG